MRRNKKTFTTNQISTKYIFKTVNYFTFVLIGLIQKRFLEHIKHFEAALNDTNIRRTSFVHKPQLYKYENITHGKQRRIE